MGTFKTNSKFSGNCVYRSQYFNYPCGLYWFLTIFPAFLYNIVGLDLAKSAGLSAVFTITGMMGQIIWPTLSDKIGRRLTLILCGCWMAVSIASFCLISGVVSVIAIQLFWSICQRNLAYFLCDSIRLCASRSNWNCK